MYRNAIVAAAVTVLIVAALFVLPFDRINWGRISILPAATITVTGTSQGSVSNQIATFNASVTTSNADKQTAINDVNTKMTALISAVKSFGIADADIKTQQVSVYQSPQVVPMMQGGTTQTQIYPMPPVRVGNGDWTASNSIEITLRDVSKASGLTDLLNNSGATNVYGPNFTTNSNTSAADADLLAKAIADAKSKADAIAKAGGQSVGRMINVQEEGTSSPIFPLALKANEATGAPVQPGTSTLSKSVTVIFELK